VKVIAHQHEGEQLPAELRNDRLEKLNKHPTVSIASKNHILVDAAIHRMNDGAWILQT
jgi:hypothetical protein